MKRCLSLFKVLFNLFYPRLCCACRRVPVVAEQPICIACEFKIKPANYTLESDNLVTQRLKGLLEFKEASCGFIFTKGGLLQHLIHALKYRRQAIVGVQLGRWYGQQLKISPLYANLKHIIPVPLHPRKAHKRGYNQSECIARGIAEVLQIPVHPNALSRVTYTTSQTKKTRAERILNVKNSFKAAGWVGELKGGILLVDDVITTGATISACVNALSLCGQRTVYVGAVALAD